MQNANVQSEEFARTQGYLAARYALVSQSSLVLAVTMGILSVFSLMRVVFVTMTQAKDSVMACLYYFCGERNTGLINLIGGVLVTIFFGLLTLALFMTYNGARNNDRRSLHNGLSMVKGSMIFGLLLSACYAVIGFCSVSVLYQASQMKAAGELPDFLLSVKSSDPITLFVGITLLGLVGVVGLISFIRLAGSLRKVTDGTELSTAGTVFSGVMSVVGSVVLLLSSFVALKELAMPSEIGNTIQLTYVGSAAANVLLLAALTTAFTALAVTVAKYNSAITAVTKVSGRSGFHYPYATNIFPEEQSRPDYVNPVVLRSELRRRAEEQTAKAQAEEQAESPEETGSETVPTDNSAEA